MDKYKVVIVDDDELSLENLTFALAKDERFSVEGIAHNARQGKKLIAQIRPDLLFLDMELPDMTGMQLLQEMRDDLSRTMRIVFYTAYDKYMIQAIREAAFDYLLKPFDDQELKDILDRFVKQATALKPEPLFSNVPVSSRQTFIALALRRGMTAEQITQFSPCFVQIHQSYIINIDYLMIIKESKCLLYPPFDKVTELLVSRKYKKELQERFCL